MSEDPAHIVRDSAHYETVEKRDRAIRSGSGKNTAGWQKFEILQHGVKAFCPEFCPILGLGQGVGNPAPTFLDVLVHSLPVWAFQAVFHVPDLLGDCGNLRHFAPVPSRGRLSTEREVWHR